VRALVGFNAGVELGQALVVAAILPLLLYIRRRSIAPQFVRFASAPVATIGAYWLIERVFFG
jgi:hypothetical protein